LSSVRVVTLLAADIVSTQVSVPGEAREFSRVEMIMRARDTTYVQLPAQQAVLPSPIDEPKAVASHLAVEIDRAELHDAHRAGPSSAVIRAPSHQMPAKAIRPPQVKIAAPNLRSPVPESEVAAITSLKAAVQAQAPAKPEPVRKRLARRDPNAGELVRMQLLNQI
jgi:hypothetical protein